MSVAYASGSLALPIESERNDMSENLTRRTWLATAAVGGLTIPFATASAEEDKDGKTTAPFRYGLNTATLMGQKLSIIEEVEIAGRAGYQAIEPWVRELDKYVKDGGSLKDLGKRIRD